MITMLFLLFFYLIFGATFYFVGMYFKKNPYSWVQNDTFLSKKRIPPEKLDLYAEKSSKAWQILGVFLVIFGIVQFFICLVYPDFSLIAMVVVIMFPLLAPLYPIYYRKILTGKAPIGIIIFMSIIGLFVLLTMKPIAQAYIESSVIVENEKIRITGASGLEIPIAQLEKVFVTDTIPRFTSRHGLAIGAIRKGDFRAPSLQANVRLLLHSNRAPYLYIVHSDNRYVILNFRRGERTLEVYEQLKGLIER